MTNTSRWMFNNTLTILLQYLCYLLIAEQFRSFESELPRKMLCKNISRLSRSHHSCEEDQVWLYRWWELAVKYEFFFLIKPMLSRPNYMFPVTKNIEVQPETEAWQARENKLNREKQVTGYRGKRGKSIMSHINERFHSRGKTDDNFFR